MLLAALPVACGKGSSGASCVQGQQTKCFGPSQCPGYQVC